MAYILYYVSENHRQRKLKILTFYHSHNIRPERNTFHFLAQTSGTKISDVNKKTKINLTNFRLSLHYTILSTYTLIYVIVRRFLMLENRGSRAVVERNFLKDGQSAKYGSPRGSKKKHVWPVEITRKQVIQGNRQPYEKQGSEKVKKIL